MSAEEKGTDADVEDGSKVEASLSRYEDGPDVE